MAFANNINKDMTAADARAVAGSSSWGDIYPDGFDFEADPMEFLGEHRLFFDTHGTPHFASGKNPFSGELAGKLSNGEKDGLLARKWNSSKIRDKRSSYGEPKEWDHIVVGLTRAESEALGPDGVKQWAQTVIKAMQDSPDGTGKRQMLVTPIHDDTDNIHLQFLLHRIPVNEASLSVGASYELSRNSEAAKQMKQLNTALEAAGLPMISDFRMGAYSVSEPRAVSVEELNRAAERVEEAGGITPPDLTTGPLQAARARVTPEMRHLDSMLAEAVKRQKEIESQATAAATAVAAAQHAKEALAQFEAEVAAHEALKIDHEALKEDVKKKHEQIEEAHAIRMQLIDELSTTTANLDTLRGDYSRLQINFDKLMETQAATAAKVEDLTSEVIDLKTDLKAANDDLAQATAEAEQNRKLAEAHAKSLQEAKAEIENLKTINEVARKDIADLKRQRAELDIQAKDALQAAETARGALSVAEAKNDSLQAQIDALKAQLAAATTSKESAEATLNDFKDAARNAPIVYDRLPEGLDAGNSSGLEVTTTSVSKKRHPEFPAGYKASRGLFGTDTIYGPNGKTFKSTRRGVMMEEAKKMTIDDARAMIEYVVAVHGADHVKTYGSDEEKALLARVALEKGLTVEGYSPPREQAAVSYADVKSEPVKYDGRDWSKKHPDNWIEGDMPAASKEWETAKERGEQTGSLKEWATAKYESGQSPEFKNLDRLQREAADIISQKYAYIEHTKTELAAYLVDKKKSIEFNDTGTHVVSSDQYIPSSGNFADFLKHYRLRVHEHEATAPAAVEKAAKWFEKTGDITKLSNADRMSAERALERRKAKGELADVNLEDYVKAAHQQYLDREAKKNDDQAGPGKTTKPK